MSEAARREALVVLRYADCRPSYAWPTSLSLPRCASRATDRATTTRVIARGSLIAPTSAPRDGLQATPGLVCEARGRMPSSPRPRPATALSVRSRSATARSARISSRVAWWIVSHQHVTQLLELTRPPDEEQLGMLQDVSEKVVPLANALHELRCRIDRWIDLASEFTLRHCRVLDDVAEPTRSTPPSWPRPTWATMPTPRPQCADKWPARTMALGPSPRNGASVSRWPTRSPGSPIASTTARNSGSHDGSSACRVQALTCLLCCTTSPAGVISR